MHHTITPTKRDNDAALQIIAKNAPKETARTTAANTTATAAQKYDYDG